MLHFSIRSYRHNSILINSLLIIINLLLRNIVIKSFHLIKFIILWSLDIIKNHLSNVFQRKFLCFIFLIILSRRFRCFDFIVIIFILMLTRRNISYHFTLFKMYFHYIIFELLLMLDEYTTFILSCCKRLWIIINCICWF